MKSKTIIIAFIAIVAIAAVSGAFLYKPQNNNVRIGYLPAASYGLLWVAYEYNYFEDEGLEVTLVPYPNVAQLVTALSSGSIDGAPITSVAIAAFAKNAEVVVVAGNSLDGTALIARNGSGINRLEDLSGKSLGTVQQVPGDFIFRKAILHYGINASFVEYLTPSDALQALESSNINATLLWEPYASLAEFRNLSIVLWDESVYYTDYPCCLQVFSSSFAKSNPDTVMRFVKALVKAEVFAYDHPGEASLKVQKYLMSVPLEIIYKSVFFIDPNLNRARNPLSVFFNISDLQAFYQLLVPLLITQNDYNTLVSKIDASYYENAISSLKREGFNLPAKYQ
jgi:NitT/TauT family transport system substrate-binding protein